MVDFNLAGFLIKQLNRESVQSHILLTFIALNVHTMCITLFFVAKEYKVAFLITTPNVMC